MQPVLEGAYARKPHCCALLVLSVSCCSAGLLEHALLHKFGHLHLHKRAFCEGQAVTCTAAKHATPAH